MTSQSDLILTFFIYFFNAMVGVYCRLVAKFNHTHKVFDIRRYITTYVRPPPTSPTFPLCKYLALKYNTVFDSFNTDLFYSELGLSTRPARSPS